MDERVPLVVRKEGSPQVKVYLTPEVERSLDARLARIEGHVRSVRRMLAEHEDCDALLIQLAAIRAAVTQAIVKLLEGHIDTCVTACVASEEGGEALEGLKRALAVVLKNS